MVNVTFGKFNLSDYAHCAVVTDSKIAKLYGIEGDNVYLLPRGERAKSFKHAQALCSWFLARNLSTRDTVVAVGGGSVGDTVGFATSIYKRGVNVLHVPTTLLAQVDSSIGGKTAINLDGVKNAVGSYHFGDTLIDTDFLQTLPSEQMRSGLGEVFKYRMLSSSVDQVYDNGRGDLTEVIKACARYKQSVCESDPYCEGERNMLNFGHTIGHAMELGYKLPHGIAVANGMLYEIALASKLHRCSVEYADKWMKEIAGAFPLYSLIDQMFTLTLNDKKNAQGKVCFVLPSDFSQTFLTLDQAKELLFND